MNFKLILNIAIHLLRARLKQTIVAAVGVTFGIAMFITLVSFMNGLNDLLDGLMLNRTPHVRLYNEIKPSEKQPISFESNFKNNTNFIASVKPKDRGKAIYNCKSIIHTLKQDQRIQKLQHPFFLIQELLKFRALLTELMFWQKKNYSKLANILFKELFLIYCKITVSLSEKDLPTKCLLLKVISSKSRPQKEI